MGEMMTTSDTATDDSGAAGAADTDFAAGRSGLGRFQPDTITPTTLLLTTVAAGAAVSLALGVYSKVHTPTGDSISTFGFDSVLPMKAWFTTVAATLALAQIATALWMWGRLPGVERPAPSWAVHGHRWFGTVAFLFTLPVAYQCLWSLGFQDTSTRVLLHSLLGCAFYGAFTTKMLVLRSDRVPARTMPIVGGLLAAVLVAIWWTSAFWFFTNVGFPQ
jgi:hypothetical protein